MLYYFRERPCGGLCELLNSESLSADRWRCTASLSVCLSVCRFICLVVCLSVLYVYMSVYPSDSNQWQRNSQIDDRLTVW